MKKILVSMMTIALVSALIGGGIYAAFNDSETGSMEYSAGTLDLTANGASASVTLVSVTDAYPGQEDIETIALRNIGSVNGLLKVSVGNIADTESTGTTGTADSGGASTLTDAALTQADDYWVGYNITITAGTGSGQTKVVNDFVSATNTLTVDSAWTTLPDNTSEYALYTEYERDATGGAGVGELGTYVTIAFFVDVDGSGTWNTDDIGIKSDGSTYTNTGAVALDYATLASYSTATPTAGYALDAASEATLAVAWKVSSSADNTIQGDSLTADISFTLAQAS